MNDYSESEEENESKVYMTLSLSKYQFLKRKKIGDTGQVGYRGEIESSSKDGHEIMFHDIMNKKEAEK